MEITQEEKFYAEVVNKAWEDADFKKELVANPVAAIEKLTGKTVNLPKGKKLVIRDQTDETKVFINIPTPPKDNRDDVELNEEQLEAVAGGCQWGNSGLTDGDFNPWKPTLPGDFTIIK
jgi:hypothetical protein